MAEVQEAHMDGGQVNKDKLVPLGYVISRISNPENPLAPNKAADEIVGYQGRQYKLVGTAESLEGLSRFKMAYPMFRSQGVGWFVVADFTSENHTAPVAAVFVELSDKNPVNPNDMVTDYREAIARITPMG